MRSFSLSVPVVFCTFNRYDVTMKVFLGIKSAKPNKLYLVSDGARDSKTGERAEVDRIRSEIERSIDWDCELIKLYADNNMGCAERISSALDIVFENEEMAIILEDDCYPAASFFEFCQTLLEKYKDDDRIMSIGGNTVIDYHPKDNTDYYYTTEFSCWGWATWKRSWDLFDIDMKDFPVKIKSQKRYLKSTIFDKRAYWNYMAQWRTLFKTSSKNSWAYVFFYESVINEKLNILPAQNLIRNLGFGKEATNTENNEDYYVSYLGEISFPLRSPGSVERELQYDSLYYKLTQRAGLVIRIKEILGLDINKRISQIIKR